MKKLISILVAFAMLAGAVFAQDEGSWSVSGSGQIGARLDFVPMQTFQGSTLQWGHATTQANDRDPWDTDMGDFRGNLDVMYNIGGLSTGFGINNKDGIGASLEYNGENWAFKAAQNLGKLLDLNTGFDPSELWGNITFQALNGIFLEAAYEKETNPWQTTDYFGDVFSKKAGNNHLTLNVFPMDGLEVGFKLPKVFDSSGVDFVTNTLQRMVFGAKFSTGPVGVAFQLALQGQGAKYANDGDYSYKDITVNDADLNSALYLGVQYQISDQMKAGLEFRGWFGGQKFTYSSGTLDPTNADYGKRTVADAVGIGIAARFNYDDGPFGAEITIKFEDNDDMAFEYDRDGDGDADYWENVAGNPAYKSQLDHNQKFSIAPKVYYNVVPDYLQVRLEAELAFTERPTLQQSADLKNADDATWESRVWYMFQPGIYFNFLGTGIGDWWGFSTGIAVEYCVKGTFTQPAPHDANYLQISLKWSF